MSCIIDVPKHLAEHNNSEKPNNTAVVAPPLVQLGAPTTIPEAFKANSAHLKKEEDSKSIYDKVVSNSQGRFGSCYGQRMDIIRLSAKMRSHPKKHFLPDTIKAAELIKDFKQLDEILTQKGYDKEGGVSLFLSEKDINIAFAVLMSTTQGLDARNSVMNNTAARACVLINVDDLPSTSVLKNIQYLDVKCENSQIKTATILPLKHFICIIEKDPDYNNQVFVQTIFPFAEKCSQSHLVDVAGMVKNRIIRKGKHGIQKLLLNNLDTGLLEDKEGLIIVNQLKDYCAQFEQYLRNHNHSLRKFPKSNLAYVGESIDFDPKNRAEQARLFIKQCLVLQAKTPIDTYIDFYTKRLMANYRGYVELYNHNGNCSFHIYYSAKGQEKRISHFTKEVFLLREFRDIATPSASAIMGCDIQQVNKSRDRFAYSIDEDRNSLVRTSIQQQYQEITARSVTQNCDIEKKNLTTREELLKEIKLEQQRLERMNANGIPKKDINDLVKNLKSLTLEPSQSNVTVLNALNSKDKASIFKVNRLSGLKELIDKLQKLEDKILERKKQYELIQNNQKDLANINNQLQDANLFLKDLHQKVKACSFDAKTNADDLKVIEEKFLQISKNMENFASILIVMQNNWKKEKTITALADYKIKGALGIDQDRKFNVVKHMMEAVKASFAVANKFATKEIKPSDDSKIQTENREILREFTNLKKIEAEFSKLMKDLYSLSCFKDSQKKQPEKKAEQQKNKNKSNIKNNTKEAQENNADKLDAELLFAKAASLMESFLQNPFFLKLHNFKLDKETGENFEKTSAALVDSYEQYRLAKFIMVSHQEYDPITILKLKLNILRPKLSNLKLKADMKEQTRLSNLLSELQDILELLQGLSAIQSQRRQLDQNAMMGKQADELGLSQNQNVWLHMYAAYSCRASMRLSDPQPTISLANSSNTAIAVASK